MRTASMVLGIVGGSLVILGAVILIFMSIAFSSIGNEFDNRLSYDDDDIMWDDFDVTIEGEDYLFQGDFKPMHRFGGSAARMGFGFASGIMLILAIINLAGGALGLVGGIIVKRNNTVGGVLMLVAAFIGFGAFVLFLVGGILALVKDNSAQPQIQPPVA